MCSSQIYSSLFSYNIFSFSACESISQGVIIFSLIFLVIIDFIFLFFQIFWKIFYLRALGVLKSLLDICFQAGLVSEMKFWGFSVHQALTRIKKKHKCDPHWFIQVELNQVNMFCDQLQYEKLFTDFFLSHVMGCWILIIW